MSDEALKLVASYGAPALFGVLLFGAIGLPVPGTILLLAAGAFVSTGDLVLWQVLVLATLGTVLGDLAGYLLGRWGGERFLAALIRRTNGARSILRARAFVVRWGAAAIFFTRWLIGPLGPWINVGSGSVAYPWRRFLCWDILGETIWVGLYVTIGTLFGDRIQAIADLVGSVGLTLAGLAVAVALTALLLRYVREAARNTRGA